jgi:hypothetical protein
MPFSTCCGAHTIFAEGNICPSCLQQCDWEEEQDMQDDVYTENK